MDLLDVLKKRRSVRRFKQSPVPRDDIRRIIEAATLAPNGSNAQPWHFLVLTDPDRINALRNVVDAKMSSLAGEDATNSISREGRNFVNLFAWAPAVICVYEGPYTSHTDKMLGEKAPEVVEDRRIVVNTALQSVAAAIACLTLAAHALGYGTCWMTAPLLARKEMEELLKGPDEHKLVAIVPLGAPDGELPRVKRKPVDDVLEIR